MTNDLKQFDAVYSEKGRGVLDRIFGEFTPERDRVRLTRPKREREIIFIVDYEDRRQYDSVLAALCNWLEKEGSFEDLRDLMLH